MTGVAAKIFGQYVWSFEVTSALLITAAMGAMVLAHRERLGERRTQRQLSERRVRLGQHQSRACRRPVFRPAQRGGHPGAAARRDAQPAVRLARAPRPSAGRRPTSSARTSARMEDEIEEGGRR